LYLKINTSNKAYIKFFADKNGILNFIDQEKSNSIVKDSKEENSIAKETKEVNDSDEKKENKQTLENNTTENEKKVDLQGEMYEGMTETEKNDYQIALALHEQENTSSLSPEKKKELEELNTEIAKCDYIFKPVTDNEYLFSLEFSKETKVKEFKDAISVKLQELLQKNNVLDEDQKKTLSEKLTPELFRLRIITTRMETQTILQNNASVKSLNLYSPINMKIELLESEEVPLTNKQIELVLFERDILDKNYRNPYKFIWTYTDTPTTHALYEEIEKITGIKNFSLAKYYKANYRWERILNNGENLKKSASAMRDGDYIAYRNEDQGEELEKILNKDDWQTELDKKLGSLLKLAKGKKQKGKGGKGRRFVEHNLGIKLED